MIESIVISNKHYPIQGCENVIQSCNNKNFIFSLFKLIDYNILELVLSGVFFFILFTNLDDSK